MTCGCMSPCHVSLVHGVLVLEVPCLVLRLSDVLVLQVSCLVLRPLFLLASCLVFWCCGPRLVLRLPSVLNPGKGVCADPVERGAILEGEGPGPPSGDSEHQLSPDREGGKT